MKRIFLLATICFFSFSLNAQLEDSKKASLHGYLKYLNTVMIDEADDLFLVENLLHNRLNYKWYVSDNLTFTSELRTRVIYGDFVELMPNYNELVTLDNGYLHYLTQTVFSAKSALMTTSFDRFALELTLNKFVITAGRQRINWGQSFAWNPNDIFNAFSFFDFDYEERPGSDAIRVQYYPNYTSVFDVAVKIDKNNTITAGGLFRFNTMGFDLQFLAGISDTSDFVAGFGWSGNLFQFGFNGEASYFHSQKNFSDTTGLFIITTGLNYMLSNSMLFTLEGIYNGYFDKLNLSAFSDIFFMPLSVKTTSFSKFSWMVQWSYPVHPLFNASLAAMYFPSFGNSYFINPSLVYSACDNMEISLYGQIFAGNFDQINQQLNLVFLRFRISF